MISRFFLVTQSTSNPFFRSFNGYSSCWSNIDKFSSEWIDENYTVLPSSVPIVFRPEFSLSNCLDSETLSLYEVRSRWDFKRYQKVSEALVESNIFSSLNSFDQYIPCKMAKDSFLEKHHPSEYIKYVHSTDGFSDIFVLGREIRTHLQDNPHLLSLFIEVMQIRVGGTILAGELAKFCGFSVVLGGSGSHHASSQHGHGWCAFGDIQLSILNLREKHGMEKIMIVDLDSHQSDGITKDRVAGLLGNESEIFLIDVFNGEIWPYRQPERSKKQIKDEADVFRALKSGTSTEEYLENVSSAIDEGLERFGVPDVVFFVAGSDILTGDIYGKLDVSSTGLVERDEIVFQKLYCDLDIPVCVTMGGGYGNESWKVVVESFENLEEKFQIISI